MTLLNLTWSNHNAGGGPLKFGDQLEHFINTALPGLGAGWRLDTINVKYGSSNPGKQGGVIERISDGAQFNLFTISGDNDETIPGGNGGTLASLVGHDGANWIGNGSGVVLGINKRFGSPWTAKSDLLGTNGSNALKGICYEIGTNTGYFIRGETLRIAGTYDATIREVIPDLGMILIENWSSGNPTYGQIDSGASLSGLTSGASATSHATFNPGSTAYTSAEPVGVFYLKNVTGAAPTGTITGGTTGYTATYSAYAANEGGKLTVTSGTGRWMLGETVSWTGGSAEIAFWDWGFDQTFYCNTDATGTNLLRDSDSDDWSLSDYLIGYDTDRLVVLFPQGNAAAKQYAVFLFGKWCEDLYGLGEFDIAWYGRGNVGSLLFDANTDTGGCGLYDNGEPVHIGTAGAAATATRWAGWPITDIDGGALFNWNFTYTGGSFTPPLLSADGYSALSRMFMGQWPLSALSARSPQFKILGFFYVPEDNTANFKDLLAHPGGDRVGLKIGGTGISRTYIEFTDGSIVP